MAGGGGGGKAEEPQPHPPKEQLPGVHFCITSPPSWPEAIILGFQHYIVMLGTTVLIPTALVPQMGGGNEEKAKVIQTLLFVAGLNTFTQTLFGSRLPAVIGGSYTFVAATISIILAGRFSDDGDPIQKFKRTMRAIQGAMIVASTLQIVLGFSGLWRNVTRFLSPLSAVPLVSLAGFGLYELGFPGVAKCVEIGLPQLIILILVSQYMPHVIHSGKNIFDRFAVIFTVVIVWIYAHLLTVGGAYNGAAPKTQASCRTDRAGLTFMQQPLCHDSERSALLQFKQSFLIDGHASGDPSAYPKVAMWKSHGEGEEGSDCCSWDGVECDRETGHVIGLHLASSCLYGSINSSNTLFSLVHLRRLDLSGNDFNYSEIPFGVGQLSRLRSLDLSYSRFSGQIPSKLLALSNLVFLDLSANPMLQLQKPSLRNLVQNFAHLKKLRLSEVNISSTIPHELANLSSLTTLFLRECGLHGEFPMNIFQLPSLKFLSVSYNPDLIGYLPEFQETSPLKELYLYGTSFSGELPTSIGRLGSLTELDISSCNFTGLVPSPLGHLHQLSYLDLSNNSFSGQIPSSMANLTQLTVLGLSLNNFSVGTLAWLGEQTKLTALYLRQINLIGEIPFSLVNMSKLTILTLADNQLSGQIPSWLMNLTQLTALDLGGNNLEGGIPSSLFELVNLQFLSVEGNSLNGTVELNMLLKLKNLTDFQLSDNKLSLLGYTRTNVTLPKFKLLGLDSCNLTEFPDFLQNQDELELLFLSNNKIHGPIPKWIWNISKENLGVLDLSGNLLTGFDLHPVVLPWSKLSILKLDSNMLQGSLPIPPPSIITYSVSKNKLNGEISPLICNMSSLMLLDLSSNNLSGRIPQCLANLSKSLFVLDLGSNSLDGPIPQTCTTPNNLRVIDLGENQFQGQIPRSFANCMMLEHLVLGNNQIDDIFPFWLGALPQLQVLILRSNRFHGEIGSWHSNFRFPKLRIVDLSDNKFIGDLPSEYFQNWDAMKLTDIANDLRYMQASPEFQIPGYGWTMTYMYSMTMTNRGMQRFYEEIPDIFKAIDFSGNNFKGQIPTSIGNLRGLHLLNLGGNNLTGHIPSSLGSLTQLESLDLSQNQLSGEIPLQLTRITFLAFFSVSHNHLTGPIPQGNQFTTFPNASFDGNPGLCGSPLSKACGSSEASPPTSSSSKQGSTSEFDWKFVFMGYGSGLVIGVSIGYCLTSWKHEWFVKTFGKRQRKWTRKERRGHRG